MSFVLVPQFFADFALSCAGIPFFLVRPRVCNTPEWPRPQPLAALCSTRAHFPPPRPLYQHSFKTPNLCVYIYLPADTLSPDEVSQLFAHFQGLIGTVGDDNVVSLWLQALAYVRVLYPDLF